MPADDARILDTHVAYLKDSVFISDVENLILNEQLTLEAAIAKVITDFDRIFRLVQNETLRERAVDLRDVGIRVLRHLERMREGEGGGAESAAPTDYVLVARELSIVDMFNLENEHVLGILTEEGGLTSHAAILARSMRIPTLTGVDGLLGTVREGDFVILDATEGVVRVNPDERGARAVPRARGATSQEPEPRPRLPRRADRRCARASGMRLSASCGNLPEVDQAAELGLACDRPVPHRADVPGREATRPRPSRCSSTTRPCSSAARGAPVTFRLLHVDSSLGLAYLHERPRAEPGAGRARACARCSRASRCCAASSRPCCAPRPRRRRVLRRHPVRHRLRRPAARQGGAVRGAARAAQGARGVPRAAASSAS